MRTRVDARGLGRSVDRERRERRPQRGDIRRRSQYVRQLDLVGPVGQQPGGQRGQHRHVGARPDATGARRRAPALSVRRGSSTQMRPPPRRKARR